jgi:hypothetical protein
LPNAKQNEIENTPKTAESNRFLQLCQEYESRIWVALFICLYVYRPASSNMTQSRDPNGVGFDSVYDNLGRVIYRQDTYEDETANQYQSEDYDARAVCV